MSTAWAVLWIRVTYGISKIGEYSIELGTYFRCSINGVHDHLDCEQYREEFEEITIQELQVLYLILFAFLNLSSLPLIIEYKCVKDKIISTINSTLGRDTVRETKLPSHTGKRVKWHLMQPNDSEQLCVYHSGFILTVQHLHLLSPQCSSYCSVNTNIIIAIFTLKNFCSCIFTNWTLCSCDHTMEQLILVWAHALSLARYGYIYIYIYIYVCMYSKFSSMHTMQCSLFSGYS